MGDGNPFADAIVGKRQANPFADAIVGPRKRNAFADAIVGAETATAVADPVAVASTTTTPVPPPAPRFNPPPAPEYNPAMTHVARTAQRFVEDSLFLPRGQVEAASAVAHQAYDNPLTRGLMYARRIIPGIATIGPGAIPTAADFDKVASKDEHVSALWQKYRDVQAHSREMGSKTDDDAAYAARVELERAIRDEYAKSDAKRQGDFSADPGRYSKVVLTGKQPTGPEPTSEEFIQRAVKEREVPGVHRPPLSDDEIASAFWDDIRSASAGELDKQPWLLKALGSGAASGVHLGTLGPLAQKIAPMAESGAFARGVAHGAIMEGASQGLSVATGRQHGVDVGGALLGSLSFGAAVKVGEAVAKTVDAARTGAFASRYGQRGFDVARGAAAIDDMDKAALGYIEETRKAVHSAANWTTVGATEAIPIVTGKIKQMFGGDAGSDVEQDPVYQRVVQAVVAALVGGMGDVGKAARPRESDRVLGQRGPITAERVDAAFREAQRNLIAERETKIDPITGEAVSSLTGNEVESNPVVSTTPYTGIGTPKTQDFRVDPVTGEVVNSSIEQYARGRIGPQSVRRAELEQAMQPEPAAARPVDAAKDALTKDIEGATSNDRKAALADPDYVHRIADAFSVPDAQRSELIEHALDVATRPEPPSKPANAFADAIVGKRPSSDAEFEAGMNARSKMFAEDRKRLMGEKAEPKRVAASKAIKTLVDSGNHEEAKRLANDAVRGRRLRRAEADAILNPELEKFREQEKKPHSPGEKIDLHSGIYLKVFDYGNPEPSANVRREGAVESASAAGESIRAGLQRGFEKVIGEKAARGAITALSTSKIPPGERAFFKRRGEEHTRELIDLSRKWNKVERFVDALGGKDPAKRKMVEELAYWSLAKENLDLEGSGARQGVPESRRAEFEAAKSRLSPTRYAELEAAVREHSDAVRKVYDKLVEQGAVPLAVIRKADGTEYSVRYQQATKTGQRKVQAPPPVVLGPEEKLVGGKMFTDKQGGYLTQHIARQEEMSEASGNLRAPSLGGAITRSVKDMLGYKTRAFRGATSRKTLTNDAAVGKGLDPTPRHTMNTALVEMESLDRVVKQNHFREEGKILNHEEIAAIEDSPDRAKEIAGKADAFEKEASELKKSIASRKAEMKKLGSDPEADTESLNGLSVQNRADNAKRFLLMREAYALRKSLTFKGWTKLEGAEYGAFDSRARNGEVEWYVRNDLVPIVRAQGIPGPLARIYNVIARYVKSGKTGLGYVFRIVSDVATNTFHDMHAGFNKFSKTGEEEFKIALGHIFQSKLRKSRAHINDELLDEFEALSEHRGWLFAGPGDLQGLDERRLEQARAALSEAASFGDILASKMEVIEQSIQRAFDKIPAIGALRQGYRSFTDELSAYFDYRMARKHGPFDSGPLSVEEAGDYVASLYDMKALPGAIHALSLADSFARYHAKQGQSYFFSQWKNEPRLYGHRIRTKLDRPIFEAPGSPAAQASVVARGFITMAAKFAEVALPIYGMQRALVYSQMRPSDKERGYAWAWKHWEEALDELYKNSPSPTAWLQKKFTLPAGIREDGSYNVTYLDWAAPYMAALVHWSPDQSIPLLNKIVNPNVVVSPILQWGTKTDYRGNRIPTGWMPGDNKWPLLGLLLPYGITGAAEVAAKLARDPEWEDRIGYELARYFLALKVKIAQTPPGYYESQVNEYKEAGKITEMVDQKTGQRHLENALGRFDPERKSVDQAMKLAAAERIAETMRRKVIRYQQELEDLRIR